MGNYDDATSADQVLSLVDGGEHVDVPEPRPGAADSIIRRLTAERDTARGELERLRMAASALLGHLIGMPGGTFIVEPYFIDAPRAAVEEKP